LRSKKGVRIVLRLGGNERMGDDRCNESECEGGAAHRDLHHGAENVQSSVVIHNERFRMTPECECFDRPAPRGGPVSIVQRKG